MTSTQHVLHLARMANRAGASSVEVQEFRECVERLVATQHAPNDRLIIETALPTYPSADGLCHKGICTQEQCRHCTTIRKAHEALDRVFGVAS